MSQFTEEYGTDYTDTEVSEAAHNLVGLYDLLLKIDRRQQAENSEPEGGVDMHTA